MKLQVYAIINSNYHTSEEISRTNNKARDMNLNLHILSKHEIENYAIKPSIILRYILKNKRKGTATEESVSNLIDCILENMKDALIIDSKDKVFRKSKDTSDIISGREFFNILSSLTEDEFGITISARQLIPYFRPNEVPN